MKIILTAIITLFLVFAISFLLDLKLIQDNWLRYTTIVLLSISVLLLGFKIVVAQIKKLKEKN